MGKFAEEYSAVRFGLTVNHRSARRIVELTAAVATQLGRKNSAAGRYAAEGIIGVQVAPTETAEREVVAKWVSSLLRDGLPPAEVAPGEDGPMPAEEIAVLGRTAASLRQTKIALDRAGIAWAEAVRLPVDRPVPLPPIHWDRWSSGLTHTRWYSRRPARPGRRHGLGALDIGTPN
jgi:superfamily I DNA/RNA helicase